jgi:hypothetical protein
MGDMMEKIAIRCDNNLTKAARKIFGDIVDSAYITTWDIDSTEEDVSSRLNDCKYGEQTNGKITYDARTIWIKFTNNNMVEFFNSEWASISRANIDNSYTS